MKTRSSRRSTGGYITAELAVALPAVLVVVLLSMWLLSCVAAQLRCVDAARAGARSAARGDAAAQSAAITQQRAPRGARVAVTTAGGVVRVVVRAEVHPLGVLLPLLPATPVSATAVAEREAPGRELPGREADLRGLGSRSVALP